MKIEKLSDFSMKIILNEDDLSEYGIKYDNWDSNIAVDFLLSVSEEIKEETGADITHEKLYVEIFSKISGCLIFISFPPNNNSSKNTSNRIVCTFNDYNSLKKFCCFVNQNIPEIIKSSSLYFNSSVLRLVIDASGSYTSFLADSVGDGHIQESDDFTDAVTLEYYTCVEENNAVTKIAMA